MSISWEYLAGFFDGEGCIHCSQRSYGRYIIVSLSQGSKNEIQSHILRDIHIFLTHNYIKTNLKADKNLRADKEIKYYKLIACSKYAVHDWLTEMLPFLRVKHQAAIAALNFLHTIKKPWLSPRHDKEILELRRENKSIKAIAQMMRISHMGVKSSLMRQGMYVPMRTKVSIPRFTPSHMCGS